MNPLQLRFDEGTVAYILYERDFSPEVIQEYLPLLTQDEIQKPFIEKKIRTRFLLRRILQRKFQADHLNHFCNFSSSEGWMAFAFSKENPVGVDIESVAKISHMPEQQWEALLEYALSVRERIFLKKLHYLKQKSFFTQLWTIKEAVLKATRNGLHDHLADWTLPCEQINERTFRVIYQEKVFQIYLFQDEKNSIELALASWKR